MRDNFHVMQSLAKYTRVDAENRIARLLSFNRRLHNEPEVRQELKQWNLALDNNLIDVNGRVLPPERVIFGGKVAITPTNGDWGREMQSKRCLIVKELVDWVVIVSERERRTVQVLLHILCICYTHSMSQIRSITKKENCTYN